MLLTLLPHGTAGVGRKGVGLNGHFPLPLRHCRRDWRAALQLYFSISNSNERADNA
jgi:hypothetical protein